MTLDEFYWTRGLDHDRERVGRREPVRRGLGQDVSSNNVNLHFDWGVPYEYLSLAWGECGGNVNLIVNGEVANVPDMYDLDNLTIGGVLVAVFAVGGSTGGLELFGPIHSSLPSVARSCGSITSASRIGRFFADDFEFSNTNRWSNTVP